MKRQLELIVDEVALDLAEETSVALTYDADRLLDPAAEADDHTLRIELPHSATNDERFGREVPLFNTAEHPAQLGCDGAVLVVGRCVLVQCSDSGFLVELRWGGAAWARRAADRRMKQLPLQYNGYLTPTEISMGWSINNLVKFLPVWRDSYDQQNDAADLQPVLRLLTPDDYHPFISVAAAWKAIFEEAGYSLESRFLESDLFRSLFFSGAYAQHDTTAAEARMGFRAVRLSEASATADAVGRVYATPYGAGNIIGNIVQTATPLAVDNAGIVHTEAYNNGNCFGLEDQKIVYRPLSTVSVAFEYHIRYTTEHRIVDRNRLAGFDSFNLGTGGNLTFRLPNRYVDRRGELSENTAYRVVVFGAGETVEFRILYTLNGVASSLWTDFTGRSARLTTPVSGSCSDPVLYYRMSSGTWNRWTGDWALYDGHIEERGETTVECTIRTPAETVGPASPKYFNTIFFYGADEGMRFLLHRECSVRPLFSPAPAYGERLNTEAICRHDVAQIEWIEAIAQMFRLRFFTDERRKCVLIEPDAEFWDESRVADWEDRTDWTQPIVWEDEACGLKAERIYGYRSGDGASARLVADDDAEEEPVYPFGSWHTATQSQACIPGLERRTNPLFAPTVSAAGGYADAPSALLPVVGDRDDMEQNGVNFTPRILRWFGMRTLPAGEQWPNPAGAGNVYPLAAFHLAAEGEQSTLCFEDRDGLEGLHRYYDRDEAIRNRRRAVTLTLRMEPHEFEALFNPGCAVPDLRSLFRIATDQGEVCATLRRIEAYDPVAASARCRFTLLPDDRS